MLRKLVLVQGARSEVIAVQRIRGRRFAPGAATLRATATGTRAWLRQPPPVVREVAVEIRRG